MLYVFAARFESGRSSCSRRQTIGNILARTAQQDVAGCGLTLAECALILVTFHEPKNFSPTCKMLIHFQVDFCGPFSRVAWTGFLSLTCRAEASLAFTVRKPESSKQVGTEAGAAAAEADSQMPTKQNVSFWGWHKKKGAGVGTFPFPLTLSLSHLAHPPFAT